MKIIIYESIEIKINIKYILQFYKKYFFVKRVLNQFFLLVDLNIPIEILICS